MSAAHLRRRDDCRLCGGRELEGVLSLGSTPLANEFVRAEDRGTPQEQFPLELYLCRGCGHLQLLDVVDPELLFRDYVYVSSTSPVFVEHFRRYAHEMIELTQMPRGAQVVEIGSNDGAMLRVFQAAGMQVLGIDPAQAIAAEATRNGVRTVPEFFSPALAARLRAEGWKARVVVANNVFAHVDDLHGIVQGVAEVLEPEGLFVFEVSYLVDVLEGLLFDTIYHEHVSYHAVGPLVGFFARHGMKLVDARRVPTHGGSLRGIAARAESHWTRHARVEELTALEEARGLSVPATYHEFSERIHARKQELLTLLRDLKGRGQRIVGFGAPAKATTLMFHFGIGGELLDYLIDESPWKQGLYSPGHHLGVRPSSTLYDGADRPDYALILAWNFAPSIISRHQAFLDRGGHFIVPLPRLEVYPALSRKGGVD